MVLLFSLCHQVIALFGAFVVRINFQQFCDEPRRPAGNQTTAFHHHRTARMGKVSEVCAAGSSVSFGRGNQIGNRFIGSSQQRSSIPTWIGWVDDAGRHDNEHDTSCGGRCRRYWLAAGCWLLGAVW